MRITVEGKDGKVVGEAISDFCVNVHVEGHKDKGICTIPKSAEDVTKEDLLKASEEIMARVVEVEE